MILLISSTFPPEPVVSANLSIDLATELSKIREVKVITPRPSRPKGFINNPHMMQYDQFEQVILQSFIYPKSGVFGRMIESFSFGKYAARYIKKNSKSLDCIYFNAWPLLAQFLIVHSAKKYSIPSIIHVQDIYPESLTDKFRLFQNILKKLLLPIDIYILRNSSKVITISPNMRTYLINSRGLNKRKVELIYNWQNEDRFLFYKKSEIRDPLKAYLTFMYLGSLNKTASIKFIISAFKTNRIINSRLIIAGSGSEKDSLVSMVDNSINPNIEFWDAPLTMVPEIQDKADVLILPLNKGAARFALPSKLIAYMLSAKPIIACIDSESDTASIIIKSDCGWIIPPESTSELIMLINKTTSLSKKELERKGNNGFNYAIKNFSRKENLQKLVNLILETF